MDPMLQGLTELGGVQIAGFGSRITRYPPFSPREDWIPCRCAHYGSETSDRYYTNPRDIDVRYRPQAVIRLNLPPCRADLPTPVQKWGRSGGRLDDAWPNQGSKRTHYGNARRRQHFTGLLFCVGVLSAHLPSVFVSALAITFRYRPTLADPLNAPYLFTICPLFRSGNHNCFITGILQFLRLQGSKQSLLL